MYMYVVFYVCVSFSRECKCLRRHPKPSSGVRDLQGPLDVDGGNQIQVLCKRNLCSEMWSHFFGSIPSLSNPV